MKIRWPDWSRRQLLWASITCGSVASLVCARYAQAPAPYQEQAKAQTELSGHVVSVFTLGDSWGLVLEPEWGGRRTFIDSGVAMKQIWQMCRPGDLIQVSLDEHSKIAAWKMLETAKALKK